MSYGNTKIMLGGPQVAGLDVLNKMGRCDRGYVSRLDAGLNREVFGSRLRYGGILGYIGGAVPARKSTISEPGALPCGRVRCILGHLGSRAPLVARSYFRRRKRVEKLANT
jgi:hypothetical protein